MSTVVEEIIEKIHELPLAEQGRLREMLNNDEAHIKKEHLRRTELSDKIMGKYKHIRTSSEDFARRKQEEIELEDKGWLDEK